MAGQPACELSAMQLSEKSGWGWDEEGRTQAHIETEEDAHKCTWTHVHTHTRTSMPGQLHVPEHTGIYQPANHKIFPFFFLSFFVFVFKVRLRQVFPPPSPNNSFEFPSHPNMVDLRTETHPVQTKLKSYFFSVYMFLSNNFHITWKKWKTRN